MAIAEGLAQIWPGRTVGRLQSDCSKSFPDSLTAVLKWVRHSPTTSRSGWDPFFFGSLWWGGAYEVQVKVPRVAYVFVGEISPQLADNSPKIASQTGSLAENQPPFRIPNTGFNFWCRTQKETRKRRYFSSMCLFFFATKITKAQGPRWLQKWLQAPLESIHTRWIEETPGGASRMRGCHQTPEGTKSFQHQLR